MARKHVTGYSLQWQTPVMHTPAFWYYKTKRAALQSAKRLSPGTRVAIMKVSIPIARAYVIR